MERVSAYCNIQPQQETLLPEDEQSQLQQTSLQSICDTHLVPPLHPPPIHILTHTQATSRTSFPQPTSTPNQTSTPTGAPETVFADSFNTPCCMETSQDPNVASLPASGLEIDQGLDSNLCLDSDPSRSQVAVLEFQQVRLCYSLGGQLALAGCSFRLLASQSLGVCGRTGAGKSSLLAAALRLTESLSGENDVLGMAT